MVHFSSALEKRYWIYLLITVLGIFASLGVVRPLSSFLRERGLLEITFVLSLFLIMLSGLVHVFRRRSSTMEVGILIGIFAVYLMLFSRIELAEERTHLMEYSIVGMLSYEALLERARQIEYLKFPALYAMILTASIGALDEMLQFFIPGRFFDWNDLLFNGLAAIVSVISLKVLKWARDKYR